MPVNEPNNGEDWNAEERLEGFEELADSIRKKLRTGGPPVDFGSVHLYITGDLDAEDSRRVRERIVTWEAWNRAYWDIVTALGDGSGGAAASVEP